MRFWDSSPVPPPALESGALKGGSFLAQYPESKPTVK